MTRQINAAGLALVKKFESCSLEAYQDEAGVWTNGYGNTIGVDANTPDITQEQADADLLNNLADAEKDVNSFCFARMLDITDNQFSALVSLCFNCGYAPLGGSLGNALTNKDFTTASECFLLWDKVHINDALTVSQGLLNRRLAEQNLFNLPVT